MQCLVKWLDSAEENTWVPETHCNEAKLGQFDEEERVRQGRLDRADRRTCAKPSKKQKHPPCDVGVFF